MAHRLHLATNQLNKTGGSLKKVSKQIGALTRHRKHGFALAIDIIMAVTLIGFVALAAMASVSLMSASAQTEYTETAEQVADAGTTSMIHIIEQDMKTGRNEGKLHTNLIGFPFYGATNTGSGKAVNPYMYNQLAGGHTPDAAYYVASVKYYNSDGDEIDPHFDPNDLGISIKSAFDDDVIIDAEITTVGTTADGKSSFTQVVNFDLAGWADYALNNGDRLPDSEYIQTLPKDYAEPEQPLKTWPGISH